MLPGFRNAVFLIVFSSGNNENSLVCRREQAYHRDRGGAIPFAVKRMKEAYIP